MESRIYFFQKFTKWLMSTWGAYFCLKNPSHSCSTIIATDSMFLVGAILFLKSPLNGLWAPRCAYFGLKFSLNCISRLSSRVAKVFKNSSNCFISLIEIHISKSYGTFKSKWLRSLVVVSSISIFDFPTY